MAPTKCDIIVIGAGVSGLTTAYLLSTAFPASITVVAKHLPGDVHIEYSSPFAGARYVPHSAEKDRRWEERTWPWFRRLADEIPEAGIHRQKSRIYRRMPVPPADTPTLTPEGDLASLLALPTRWWTGLFPDFRELAADDGGIPAGFVSGAEFGSVCIDPGVHIAWLADECRRRGVVVGRVPKEGRIAHVLDARKAAAALNPSLEESVDDAEVLTIVVNATGLGSLTLAGVKDTTMSPARGQSVLVRGTTSVMFSASETILPRPADAPAPPAVGADGKAPRDESCHGMTRPAGAGTFLGGTFELGNWDEEPDREVGERIIQRALAVDPLLRNASGGVDVIRHMVGRRPWRRDGVRVEKEWIEREGGRGGWVVHNYGHSGWGFQGGYGCAERVLELVNEIKREVMGS